MASRGVEGVGMEGGYRVERGGGVVVQGEFMARDSKGPQPRTDRSPLSNISAHIFL